MYLQEQALVAQLMPNVPNNAKTSRAGNQPQIPYGYFVLVPSTNGTLLVKAVAVQELMLPYKASNQTEDVSEDSIEMVSTALNQVKQYPSVH